jgi:hypothetical protein
MWVQEFLSNTKVGQLPTFAYLRKAHLSNFASLLQLLEQNNGIDPSNIPCNRRFNTLYSSSLLLIPHCILLCNKMSPEESYIRNWGMLRNAIKF